MPPACGLSNHRPQGKQTQLAGYVTTHWLRLRHEGLTCLFSSAWMIGTHVIVRVRQAMVSPGGPCAIKPPHPAACPQDQQEMKLALLLNVVDPNIGGVLIMGDRGTAKSVAVSACCRGLQHPGGGDSCACPAAEQAAPQSSCVQPGSARQCPACHQVAGCSWFW